MDYKSTDPVTSTMHCLGTDQVSYATSMEFLVLGPAVKSDDLGQKSCAGGRKDSARNQKANVGVQAANAGGQEVNAGGQEANAGGCTMNPKRKQVCTSAMYAGSSETGVDLGLERSRNKLRRTRLQPSQVA
eukprot:gene14716-20756_t